MTKSEYVSDPGELLPERGISVTAQRLAVLGAVSRRTHATADAIAKDVRSEDGVILRQAEYDSVGMLPDKRPTGRIQPVGSPARYEDCVDDNHHDSIYRNCGETVDEAKVIIWETYPECQS